MWSITYILCNMVWRRVNLLEYSRGGHNHIMITFPYNSYKLWVSKAGFWLIPTEFLRKWAKSLQSYILIVFLWNYYESKLRTSKARFLRNQVRISKHRFLRISCSILHKMGSKPPRLDSQECPIKFLRNRRRASEIRFLGFLIEFLRNWASSFPA